MKQFIFWLVLIKPLCATSNLQDTILYESENDFFGDNENFSAREKRQAVKHSTSRWTNPIPYYIEKEIVGQYWLKIKFALNFLENNTCLKFVRDKTADPRIVFKFSNEDDCSSQTKIDSSQEQQYIYLKPDCFKFKTLTHEIFHRLGIEHQQERHDRNKYIYINVRNIKNRDFRQYGIYPDLPETTSYDFPYDYGSNMHYSPVLGYEDRRIMSSYDQRYQQTMGTWIGPNFLDILLLNKHYGCLDNCKPLSCMHGGYSNPSNCSKCICPWGLVGDLCNERDPGTNNCGEALEATNEWKFLSGKVGHFLGNEDFPKYCYWHITSPINTTVEIELISVGKYCDEDCSNQAVEFKMGNFTNTGFRYCCTNQRVVGQILRSDSNLAIINIYSFKRAQDFLIKYRISPPPVSHDFAKICHMPRSDPSEYFHPEFYMPGLCTHIIIHADWPNMKNDTSTTIKHKSWLNALRDKDPKIKILLYIPYSIQELFSAQKDFVYTINLLREFDFDGLSFGLGFRTQLARMDAIEYVRMLSAYIEEEAKITNNPKFLLVQIVRPDDQYYYDVKELSSLLDYLIIYTFDFNSVNYTAIAYPLYGNLKDFKKEIYTENYHDLMRSWLEQGADPNKIIIQFNSLGRSYELANPEIKTIFSKTVPNSMFKFISSSSKSYIFRVAFRQACELFKNGQRFFDEESLTHYVTKWRYWLTIDDPVSLKFKMKWFKSQAESFGGVSLMYLNYDDYEGRCFKKLRFPLARTIACELGELKFCNNIQELMEFYSRANEEVFNFHEFRDSVYLKLQESNPLNTSFAKASTHADSLHPFKPDGILTLDIDHFDKFMGNGDRFVLQRYSAPVYIRGLPWNILAIPNLDFETLEFYLRVFQNCSFPAWNVNTYAILIVHSQELDKNDFTRTITTRFNADKNGWGYAQFMKYEELTNGYLKNNTIKLSVKIWVDKPRGLENLNIIKYPGCNLVPFESSTTNNMGEKNEIVAETIETTIGTDAENETVVETIETTIAMDVKNETVVEAIETTIGIDVEDDTVAETTKWAQTTNANLFPNVHP